MSVDENEKDHHSRSLKRGLSKRAKKVRRFFKVGYSCGVCTHTHPLASTCSSLNCSPHLPHHIIHTNNSLESNQSNDISAWDDIMVMNEI